MKILELPALHVDRPQPLKMSTRDSPRGKGGRCVRLTTYHPCSAERQEIRGLNLPGPPWAISTACCGRDLNHEPQNSLVVTHNKTSLCKLQNAFFPVLPTDYLLSLMFIY